MTVINPQSITWQRRNSQAPGGAGEQGDAWLQKSLTPAWLLYLGRQGGASVAWSRRPGRGRGARGPGGCGTGTGAPAGRVGARTGRGAWAAAAGTRVGRVPLLQPTSPETRTLSSRTFPDPSETSGATRKLFFLTALLKTKHLHVHSLWHKPAPTHCKPYNWEAQEAW